MVHYLEYYTRAIPDNNVAILTLDKKYFAPRVKAYANRDAMKLDAEVNATSLATFSADYWTIVDGVPTWNV